jgi:polyhydroxyalkanoate synthesis regulator phasin
MGKIKMKIEKKVREKFKELINSGNQLKYTNDELGQIRNKEHGQECVGWLASAQNIVHLVIGNNDNPYKKSVDKICNTDQGYCIPISVGEVTVILKLLLQDIDQGLLDSIEDQTRASVFDDFLDHAKEYARNNFPNEAGVIAGVVFEDTLRTICRNSDIDEKGEKLDFLIDQLVKSGILTQVKAKRARVAAHVRTKATHAQWDEFEIEDVNTTIEFAEELILKHLER